MFGTQHLLYDFISTPQSFYMKNSLQPLSFCNASYTKYNNDGILFRTANSMTRTIMSFYGNASERKCEYTTENLIAISQAMVTEVSCIVLFKDLL